MKGTAQELLLVIMIMIFVFMISFYINISASQGQIKTETFTDYTSMMDRALFLAGEYAETILGYSAYQACYNNLKRGGFREIPEGRSENLDGEEYVIWYDTRDLSPDESAFSENLGTGIESNSRLYTAQRYCFLDEYCTQFPDYEVSAGNEGGKVKLTIASNGKRAITKMDEKTNWDIKRSLPESKLVDVNCFGLFRKGKEKGLEIFSMLPNVVETHMFYLPSQHSIVSGNCEDYLDGKIEETELNIRSDNSLSNLYSEEGDYAISTEVVQAEVRAYVEKAEEGWKHTACTFGKEGWSATVKVTVESMGDERFPVSDGENLVFDKMRLSFLVKYDTESQEETGPGAPEGTPSITAAPSSAFVNEDISFEGSTAIQNVVQYEWDFGDGSPIVISKESDVIHEYQNPGTYTVTFTVTTGSGEEAETSATIEIKETQG